MARSSPDGAAAKPASAALAAGVARASGERARRRRTPLIAPSADQPIAPVEPARATEEVGQSGGSSARAGVHRPRPVAKDVPTGRAAAGSDARQPSGRRRSRASTGRRGRASGAPGATGPQATVRQLPASRPAPLRAVPHDGGSGKPHPGSTEEPPAGVEELLQAGVAALRLVAEASGLSPEEVEHQVAATLAFLRRRVTGDFEVDEFGFDEDFTEHAYLPLLRPLYRNWFRVEVRGIEHIPSEGAGLVVANHSGTIAMDSLMTQLAVHDEHPAHRHLRMLAADLVFQTPVVGQVARKSGSTLAANPDAERLLARGQLVGVWPEGFKGIGKPFRERYKLQRFGRGGFVSAALRAGAPIIPCSIVGAEEIYPIIGDMKTVARLVGAPYAPITPTWPLLGPLGLVPLPSKWIIEFGSPIETADLGAAVADDPMVVFDLTDQVRETIQQTLYSLLVQRRSVFF
jgi:1-acyl-sn-glycerol-3-phosphate acyltransferase